MSDETARPFAVVDELSQIRRTVETCAMAASTMDDQGQSIEATLYAVLDRLSELRDRLNAEAGGESAMSDEHPNLIDALDRLDDAKELILCASLAGHAIQDADPMIAAMTAALDKLYAKAAIEAAQAEPAKETSND